MMIRYLLILTFLSPITLAYAGAYKCVVEDNTTVNEEGNMKSSNFTKYFQGQEFVVDKGTGRMSGGVSNHNAQGQPKVLDYGSKEQPYLVITTFKPYTKINYLNISEYKKSTKKPFIFVDGDDVYTGLCEEY